MSGTFSINITLIDNNSGPRRCSIVVEQHKIPFFIYGDEDVPFSVWNSSDFCFLHL